MKWLSHTIDPYRNFEYFQIPKVQIATNQQVRAACDTIISQATNPISKRAG